MDVPSVLLLGTLSLLMTESIIEIGLVGSTVAYLHHAHNDVPFEISATRSTPQFGLYPKPAHLLVDQGHTSNGAAGTALVLVCIPGFFLLWLEKRQRDRSHNALDQFQDAYDLRRKTRTWTLRKLLDDWGWLIWVCITVVSFLLTLAAIIFTFIVTQQTAPPHSLINLKTAAAAGMTRTSKPYPDDRWTPENWYKAMIALGFVDDSQKADIKWHVGVMAGWRWNLIPLLLLGLATAVLAVVGYTKKERARADDGKGGAGGSKGDTDGEKGNGDVGNGDVQQDAGDGRDDADDSNEDAQEKLVPPVSV